MAKNIKEVKAETKNIKLMHGFNSRWSVINEFDYDTFKIRCLETIKNEINNECLKISNLWESATEDLNNLCSKIAFVLGVDNYSDGFSSFEFKPLYKYLYKLNLSNKDDYIKFIYFIEIILNIDDNLINNEQLAIKLAEAIELSNANLKIIKDGDEYCIISRDIDFLDEPLVIDNLKWLNNYEEVKSHFLKSLKFERKEDLYRNIIDELRLSLELLFQRIFNNKKTLENQISQIGNYLKENNVSTTISNMYKKLIDLYAKYNNDNAKHGDEVSEVEIDYLTYLTGTFMRLILQIEEEKKKVK